MQKTHLLIRHKLNQGLKHKRSVVYLLPIVVVLSYLTDSSYFLNSAHYPETLQNLKTKNSWTEFMNEQYFRFFLLLIQFFTKNTLIYLLSSVHDNSYSFPFQVRSKLYEDQWLRYKWMHHQNKQLTHFYWLSYMIFLINEL